ncbi:MAG TPA: hypothetical protein VIF88_08190 [Methylocystis sp.]|jgi:hypothetical protein
MTIYNTFDPTSLFAEGDDFLHRSIVVKSGAAYVRGALMGRVAVGAASSAAKNPQPDGEEPPPAKKKEAA